MIKPFINAGVLDGENVLWLFHHADESMIALAVTAKSARV